MADHSRVSVPTYGMDDDAQGKQEAKLGLPAYFADLLAAQAAHRTSEPHGPCTISMWSTTEICAA